jgi:hypothetical protein
MTTIKNILVSAVLFAGVFGTAQAADQTMKPLQGVSFHAGTKHAVAYYLNESGTCKLVVTSADDANFASIRSEAEIEPGKTTTYQLDDGKQIEFACQGQALAMNVKSLETIAAH